MTLEVDIEHRLGAFRLEAHFVSQGRLTALFGSSGAGKTSLVNTIGGLIRPDRGRIAVEGTALVDSERGLFVPTHKRRVGYVFQEGRLFPHLSVRQNLAFGRWFTPRRERSADFDTVVELLGIGALLERRPGTLSGGEKQRVAIGRALLASPRLLLMDEPLASLDEARKGEILPYIERLRDEAGVPIVYVSHAVPEVARLATTLVVMEAGRVVAAGPTAQMLGRLDIAPLAGGPELGAILAGRIAAHEDAFGLSVIATRAGALRVPQLDLAVGSAVRFQIRARDVMLALNPPEGLSALNIVAGTVEEIRALTDAACDIRLDCNGESLIARLTRKSVQDLGLVAGRPVHAIIKSIAFDRQSLGETRGEAARQDRRTCDGN